MSPGDPVALLPLIVVGYASVMVLVIGAFWRNHCAVGVLTLGGLGAAFITIFAALPLTPRQVTPLLRVDSMALFFMGLFFLGGCAVAVFAHDYLRTSGPGSEKFYALVLFAILGMSVLAASNHFVSFFVGVETLSVSLYGLIGYTLGRKSSLEASLKYLVLAGASLSFLLFGMALIYFEFGAMEFDVLAGAMRGAQVTPLGFAGLGLLLVGFSFKLAVVPFHAWAPDVYQGAPAPISALIATGSKAAVFALLLRFLTLLAVKELGSLFLLLEGMAIITMLVGNLLALLQRNLKRLLAYSSITHMGYLIIPLLAGGAQGVSSLSFYFVSYFVTTIGAFGVIAALSRAENEMDELRYYAGLGFRRPWLGAALGLMMLSLAGVPPTIGFMAKFYIFTAAARSSLWLLLIMGVLNSGLAAYYYLRVLVALYSRAPEEGMTWPRVGAASGAALVALTVLVVVLGIYPTPLMALVHGMWQSWLVAP
jgi:NADH-quinone oxidoreductase subunit N